MAGTTVLQPSNERVSSSEERAESVSGVHDDVDDSGIRVSTSTVVRERHVRFADDDESNGTPHISLQCPFWLYRQSIHLTMVEYSTNASIVKVTRVVTVKDCQTEAIVVVTVFRNLLGPRDLEIQS
jgi:hypothetical protein